MTHPPLHLDLFSGIGGFALAAKWAGFETCGFVEIEDFPQRVLRKNFPGVPIHGDIRTYDATELMGRVAVATGGFPCQDISGAGKGAGLAGKRSSLWFDQERVVAECRPSFMLAENSPFLRTRGADRILGGLEEIGYAGRAFVVGACHAGAPHRRQRAFIVASHASREQDWGLFESRLSTYLAASADGWMLDPDGAGIRWDEESPASLALGSARAAGAMVGPGLPWRVCEPPVPGVDAGLPNRVDRVRALGNAVVPQVAYPFLRAIYDAIEAMG